MVWQVCLGLNGFISSRLYGYNISVDQILDHAVRIGCDGVELHSALDPYPEDMSDISQVDRFREKYRRRGLKIAGIQTFVPAASGAAEEVAIREAYADGVSKQIDFCKTIGARVAGVWPGGRIPEISDDEIISRLVDTFKRCVKKAEDNDILICMEPEPVQVDYSYEIAKAVVEEIDSSHFKIIFDFSHANVITKDPLGAIKEFEGKIGHVHLTDNDGKTCELPGSSHSSNHLEIGKGNLDIKRILEALRDSGYDEWIQVDVWENPDPLKCSERNKRLLDEILEEMKR